VSVERNGRVRRGSHGVLHAGVYFRNGGVMAQLIARDVKKVFASSGSGRKPVVALNGVSFEASGHTFVSLVGPSGCGKSTFLNIVSGVESVTEGSVELSEKGGEATIGYVFQDPRLLPWKTVMENMLYVQPAHGREKGSREKQREHVRYFLDLVGLGRTESMFPGQLSGGMQQRVGIARALSIRPHVLLMDEPFSHLDAITARGLRTELQRLWDDTDATVLFVTHDVMEAVLLSDKVLLMNSSGSIYADMPIDLARPRTQTDQEVVSTQAEILAVFEQMQKESEQEPEEDRTKAQLGVEAS